MYSRLDFEEDDVGRRRSDDAVDDEDAEEDAAEDGRRGAQGSTYFRVSFSTLILRFPMTFCKRS